MPEPGTTPRRLAVACSADPRDANAFSGIPTGILAALASLGHTGVAVAATLGGDDRPRLRQALAVRHLRPRAVAQSLKASDRTGSLRAELRAAQGRLLVDPVLFGLRSRAAARALAAAGGADGAIQYGTDFRLPAGLPYVTYDDQTVAQAARAYGYTWTEAMSARELGRLVERQRAIFAGARTCCAATHWAARSIVEDYGIDPARVRVVGIGAAPEAPPAPAPRDWSAPRFLFVGKAWERKNGPLLLDAFAAVRDRHRHARLDLVGGHPPVDAAGVTGHGLLDPADPDQRARLLGLYDEATCFVLPSLHEPAGISYIEAGLAGVGSIGTSSGGSSTLIGDAGAVVDPRDGAALRAAMLAFCDADHARAMGAAAHARAARFTWPAVTRRLAAAVAGAGPVDPL